jgi:hypothetical protein
MIDAPRFEAIGAARGITVYQDKQSPMIRIAAEGVIGAPPLAVRDALIDYERQVGVIARVSEIKVLERRPGGARVYQRLNLPVIDDRDYTLDVSWGTDGGTHWIRYGAVEEGGPDPVDGVVRVNSHSGSWQLRPAEGGDATLVRYQFHMDMAGLIPRWMVKSSAGKEVPLVFADVCKLLARQTPETGGVRVCLR